MPRFFYAPAPWTLDLKASFPFRRRAHHDVIIAHRLYFLRIKPEDAGEHFLRVLPEPRRDSQG